MSSRTKLLVFRPMVSGLLLASAVFTASHSIAQYAVCDATIDQLIARKNAALGDLDAERSQRRKEAHNRFVIGLNAELDRHYRQHAAKMEEVESRMAALEGTQFEKFFTVPAIRRDRDRVASETRTVTETARRNWRKQLFRDRAEIDRDVRNRKKVVARQYDHAVAQRRRTKCPQDTNYGSLGIRG